MKGLLIKDWKLLKGQKQFLLVLCVFLVIFGMTSRNLGFLVCYMTIMAALFSISTISYDEYNHGMGYLLTLPVSRREYVKEKYVFSLIASVSVAALSLVVTLAAGMLRHTEAATEELVVSAGAGVLAGVVMLGIMLPVQLKFGAEKSRLIGAAFGAGIFACIYGVIWITKKLGGDGEELFAKLSSLSAGAVAAIAIVLGVVILAVSMMASIRIMEKKEY